MNGDQFKTGIGSDEFAPQWNERAFILAYARCMRRLHVEEATAWLEEKLGRKLNAPLDCPNAPAAIANWIERDYAGEPGAERLITLMRRWA